MPDRRSGGVGQRRYYNEGESHEGRIAALEAHQQHAATRAWVLGGVIAGIISALTLIISALRMLGWGPSS